MPYPNLFIAGAPKSGTSSMFYYLTEHPAVYKAQRKEPRFFTGPELLKLSKDERFIRTIIKTQAEYLSLYNGVRAEQIIIDASVFLMFFDSSMKRVKALKNDAKLIIMIRNPIERFISHYQMLYSYGYERRKLKQFIKSPVSIEGIDLLKIGNYSSHIKSAQSIFGKENVLIVIFDDFRQNTERELSKVFKFLDIENYMPENIEQTYLKSTGIVNNSFINNIYQKTKPLWRKIKKLDIKLLEKAKDKIKDNIQDIAEVQPETKLHLDKYYKDELNKLESIVGRKLESWKIHS